MPLLIEIFYRSEIYDVTFKLLDWVSVLLDKFIQIRVACLLLLVLLALLRLVYQGASVRLGALVHGNLRRELWRPYSVFAAVLHQLFGFDKCIPRQDFCEIVLVLDVEVACFV